MYMGHYIKKSPSIFPVFCSSLVHNRCHPPGRTSQNRNKDPFGATPKHLPTAFLHGCSCRHDVVDEQNSSLRQLTAAVESTTQIGPACLAGQQLLCISCSGSLQQPFGHRDSQYPAKAARQQKSLVVGAFSKTADMQGDRNDQVCRKIPDIAGKAFLEDAGESSFQTDISAIFEPVNRIPQRPFVVSCCKNPLVRRVFTQALFTKVVLSGFSGVWKGTTGAAGGLNRPDADGTGGAKVRRGALSLLLAKRTAGGQHHIEEVTNRPVQEVPHRRIHLG